VILRLGSGPAAYVVPVEGDCAPPQDALESAWFSPPQARDPSVLAELVNG
jgi:hypothetical protein